MANDDTGIATGHASGELYQRIAVPDGRTLVMRRAGEEDSEAILDLYYYVYKGTYTLTVVNKQEQRLAALRDPNHYWLVIDDGGTIVGSVIFEVDPVQANGKVFAAVIRDDYRRLDLMTRLLRMAVQKLLYDDRICDVLYATTRTVTMGPRRLLRKLGFVSLGIFPNVHRLAEYETHGLHALFAPEAWQKRRKTPRLIPEVEGFYRIIRKTFQLEKPDILLTRVTPKFLMMRGEGVLAELETRRRQGPLLMDFFPFHKANFLFHTEDRSIMAWINYEGRDGYGTLVALACPRQDLRAVLEETFAEAQGLGVMYMEFLIDAYEPRMQRAAMAAQFLPCAYFPSMQRVGEERKDCLVFARSTLPLNFSNVHLTPRDRQFLDAYLQNTEFRNLVVKMHTTGPLDAEDVP